MKIINIVILLIFVSSCGHGKYTKADIHELKNEFATLNSSVRGHLNRKVFKKDLSGINRQIYLENAKLKKEPSQDKLFKIFEKYEYEVAVKGIKRNFYVCLKSVNAAVFICDKASTAEKTELVFDDMSLPVTSGLEGVMKL